MTIFSKRFIRNVFCHLIALAIIWSGAVKRAKNKSFQGDYILPIYFHNPNRKLFRNIVLWLKNNGYIFISCDQLIDILNQRVPCPRGAVWFSFDDGWKDNLENVIPVIRQYNIPITIFIYTGAVQRGIFWWQDFRENNHVLPSEYRDINLILHSPEDTRQKILQLLAQKIPAHARRNVMTIEDIKYISTIPQISIGSHLVTHPILENCNDSQIEYELGESKKILEDWTGKPVQAVAYPKGSVNKRAFPILKKYGYKLAVTIENRLANPTDDCYLVPRTDAMNDGSVAENLCHALGVWAPLINKLKHPLRFIKTK